jgi:hypothetical protein
LVSSLFGVLLDTFIKEDVIITIRNTPMMYACFFNCMRCEVISKIA